VSILVNILSYFKYRGNDLGEYFYFLNHKYYAQVDLEDVLVKTIIINEDGLFFMDNLDKPYKEANGSFIPVTKTVTGGYKIYYKEGRWYLKYGSNKIEIGSVEIGLSEVFTKKFREGLIT